MGVGPSQTHPNLESDSHQQIQSLTVIIPALNEESQITNCIKSVKKHGLKRKPEVIVVDGGSHDKTIQLAKREGVRVISSPKGRGRQLNVGWRASRSDWLLFLHADSRLPASYGLHISSAVHLHPRAQWGSFQSIKTDVSGWAMRMISLGVCLRTRIFKLPYGDQAFFVKRVMMEKMNGFKNSPLMEDFEFVQRAKRNGFGDPLILQESVFTSGRRWEALGVWNTMVINQCIILAYQLGVEEERLAKWYYNQRSKRRSKM